MAKAEFLDPGEVVELFIDLWDVAHVFRAGRRIRLQISSSNFPRFDRNLNSEVVPADGLATELPQATQQVFHDTEGASRLILPVVEGTLP